MTTTTVSPTTVIDLTKISTSRLIIDLRNAPSPPTLSTVDFFDEVVLMGNQIHACYFKKNKPTTLEVNYFYDLAFLKLPGAFQYVDVNLNTGAVVFDGLPASYRPPRNFDIFTPLLLNISNNPNLTFPNFHFCTNKLQSENGTSTLAAPNGCPYTAKSFDNEVNIFYYKGKLRTFSDENPDTDLIEREYYLMPMLLSEKYTVYYVRVKTDSNFQQILDDFTFVYKNRTKVFGILNPLVLNDEMGIMVFREFAK